MGGVLLVIGAVCLGRETGLYDFNLMRHEMNMQTTYSSSRQSPRPPLQLVRWTEVEGGIQLDYEDGSRGLMTIDQETSSGYSWMPLYKRLHVEIQTSYRSDDGNLSGTAAGSVDVSITGICSALGARRLGRTALLNQICQSLAQQRL